MAYDQSLKDSSKIQPLDELPKFMDHRYRTLDSLRQKSGPNHKKGDNNFGGGNRNVSIGDASETKIQGCIVCEKTYRLFECEKFSKLPIRKRIELVHTHKLNLNE